MTRHELLALSQSILSDYERKRTILSFDEYFELVLAEPMLQLRSSAQYMKAVFDYFGTKQVHYPYGQYTRYLLFDLEFLNGEGRVVAQEQVQQDIYRVLCHFIRSGRNHKMILMHGPNGSAKSSIVHCMMKAMSYYANQDEGAMYRFNWIFPNEKLNKQMHIGFSGHGSIGAGGKSETYAYLTPDLMDACVPAGLNEHPLFLIPEKERESILTQLKKSQKITPDFVIADYIRHGYLGKKSRAIFDALLNAYHGDYQKVLAHVQVERFYPSQKYGVAQVSIEPQMSIDAEVHQLTADRSLAALPKSLANINLYHATGPLIEANRGILDYADFLKRPIESFKYLLGAIETSSIGLAGSMIPLDVIFIGSTNEKYLNAFKEHPDFTSFKARIELIRVPYLLSLHKEIQVYESTIHAQSIGKPIAPHAIETASMWAVLTRLRRAGLKKYPQALLEIIQSLTPIEKLKLYDSKQTPARLNSSQSKDLLRALSDIYQETRGFPIYEGSTGISAREIKTVLLNASYHPRYSSLSAMAVLDELRELVKLSSVYEFLREEPFEGYHEHIKFIEFVEQAFLDKVDQEIRDSMGLASLQSYEELFSRYVVNVSHWVKQERLLDKVTGKLVEPSEDFMRDIEDSMMSKKEERIDFRKALIGQIAAYALEHDNEKPDYQILFSQYLKRLEESFFAQKQKQIERYLDQFVKYFSDQKSALQPKDIEQVERMQKNMIERFGYNEESVKETIAFFCTKRRQS